LKFLIEDDSVSRPLNADLVHHEINRLRGGTLQRLTFTRSLEDRFESDTASARSYRLWFEGLVAILFFNACLLVDGFIVKDHLLTVTLKRSLLVTPVALAVNYMMRLKLPKAIREGSVGLGTTVICCINLLVEGNRTPATASLGLMTVLITVLFVNVVMRVRFNWALLSTALMLTSGLLFAWQAPSLTLSEKTIGSSILLLGVAMTTVAGYSQERQERLGYLLSLNSDLQTSELHRISNIDALTSLLNRRAFEHRFRDLWEEGFNSGTTLSAIVIDIDHFKIVNDVHGHLYGDEVLRRVAGLLPQTLRTQTDVVARFGGEEFVILLPDTSPREAFEVAERVRRLIASAGTPQPEQLTEEQTLRITVSCGVSSCVPAIETGRERLIRAADRALYQAKRKGRNRVEARRCDLSPTVASVSGERESGTEFSRRA
jgi:diguanylate cyclase (GGDEF)-like protein